MASDLHGMLHFYKAIKDILKPEDTVYFLGDAGDCGPHPWVLKLASLIILAAALAAQTGK